MTLEFVGRILVLLAGIVAVSMSSVIMDRVLDVEVKGSPSTKIGYSVWSALKCVFLIWLMNVAVFGD